MVFAAPVLNSLYIPLSRPQPPEVTTDTHISSFDQTNYLLLITPRTTDIALAEMHPLKPDPKTRQNTSKSWPLGVVSGGMVIDMMENLTLTSRPSDWALAVWLDKHIITPFGRIERRDGLIVQSAEDMKMLIRSRWRYDEILGGKTVYMQRLWVPGLEPIYRKSRFEKPVQVPNLPKRYDPRPWRASNMYFRNGVESKRKGLLVSEWRDEWGWQRKIWTLNGDQVSVKDESSSSVRSSPTNASQCLPTKIVVTDTSMSPEGSDNVGRSSSETLWEAEVVENGSDF